MSNRFELDEVRIARLLGAVQAPADPAVLTRARARIAAMGDVPGVFAWLGTPAALAAACVAMLLSAGVSLAVLRAERPAAAARETSLVSALIDDDGSYGLPTSAAVATVTDGGAQGGPDSGTVSQ